MAHSTILTALGGIMMLTGSAQAPTSAQVETALKDRLPKTKVSSVDCSKVDGLCEVVAGENLFYVDRTARFLVIGRVYDMQTRQDLTAARLLVRSSPSRPTPRLLASPFSPSPPPRWSPRT